jgi:predicted kinase
VTVLYIFSGLPGSGKSTLAQELSKRIKAAYIRIDTIEQGIRDLCSLKVEGEGYGLAYRIAKDNLCAGVDVVADSCNTIELTRKEWENVAKQAGVKFYNIEVGCSNSGEHKVRIENRKSDMTWQHIIDRKYETWGSSLVTKIDTAGKSIADSANELFLALDIRRA